MIVKRLPDEAYAHLVIQMGHVLGEIAEFRLNESGPFAGSLEGYLRVYPLNPLTGRRQADETMIGKPSLSTVLPPDCSIVAKEEWADIGELMALTTLVAESEVPTSSFNFPFWARAL